MAEDENIEDAEILKLKAKLTKKELGALRSLARSAQGYLDSLKLPPGKDDPLKPDPNSLAAPKDVQAARIAAMLKLPGEEFATLMKWLEKNF